MQLKAEGCQRSYKSESEDVEVELIRYEEDQRPDKVELLLYAK